MNRVLAFDHMKKQYGIVAFKCLPGLLVFLLSKFQILSTSLYHLTSVGKKSCPRLSPTSLTSVSYSKCLLVRKIGLGNNECMSYGIINKQKILKIYILLLVRRLSFLWMSENYIHVIFYLFKRLVCA